MRENATCGYDFSCDSIGELMRRFVEGADRGQWTLLPETEMPGRHVHVLTGTQ